MDNEVTASPGPPWPIAFRPPWSVHSITTNLKTHRPTVNHRFTRTANIFDILGRTQTQTVRPRRWTGE